jgi:hypothetical protein
MQFDSSFSKFFESLFNGKFLSGIQLHSQRKIDQRTFQWGRKLCGFYYSKEGNTHTHTHTHRCKERERR